MIKRALIIAGIGVGLTLAGVAIIHFTGLAAPDEMSAHGWFAFAIGAVLSVLLSVGLFALAFSVRAQAVTKLMTHRKHLAINSTSESVSVLSE